MSDYFEKEYEIKYYDIDTAQRATLCCIMEYMQEASTLHTSVVGCTPEYQIENQFGWILLNVHTKIFRYPKFGEKISVRTWPEKVEKVFVFRQYEILDKDEKVIACGTSKWIMYSFERKMPMRITDDIVNMYKQYDREVISNEFCKFNYTLNNEKVLRKTSVLFRDLDNNWHMNNVKYMRDVMESIDTSFLDEYEIAEYDIQYVHQLKYNDEFRVIENKLNEEEYIYVLKKKDSQEVRPNAEVYIKWRRKSESDN